MIKYLRSLLVVLALIVAVVPAPAHAAGNCPSSAGFLAFPTWYNGLDCEEIGTEKQHVVIDDIPKFVWTVALNGLNILLQIAGILAVVMLIASGYNYLTSSGEPDKVTKAKTGLLRAIVGLAIAVMSSTIIYFIVDWI